MHLKTLGPYVFEIEELLPIDSVNSLLTRSENFSRWLPAESGYYRDHKVVFSSVMKEVRDVKVCQIDAEFNLAINNRTPKMQELIFGLTGVWFDWFSDKTVSRYEVGSHIKPHRDTAAYSTRRLFTFILYLNDQFEGGEIFFPDVGVEYTPKKGRTVGFFAECRHGVRPITAGTRHCVVFFGETKAPLRI